MIKRKVEEKKGRFRLEIEGVRALAALLVAIYHIWFNRVSGGVDVFFVISGFLITTSLYSRYRREGRIRGFSYLIRLLKRLIPTAWTIALVTFFLSLAILPAVSKGQIFTESIASLFYFENWRLAWDSVDYLGQNNEASPFQHYWALSIQFQFYIIWVVLFTLATITAKILSKQNIKRILVVFISIVVVGSLAYSIYYTNVNQPVAYYHTFTRIWEFGMGGLVAFLLRHIQLSKKASWVAGWIGVIGLLSVGIILKVSTVFPGYHALWPVLSAFLILLAGNNGGRWSAYSLLSSKPLVHFGTVSYAFYLWHWPLLIFYYALTDAESVSFLNGVIIMVIAYILASITIYGIEKPSLKIQFKTPVLAVMIAILSIGLFSGIKWYEAKTYENLTKEAISLDSHPGAAVSILDEPPTFTEEFIPSLDVAAQDVSDIYADHCINSDEKIDANVCEYGDTENYESVIVVAGGSHSAHWQPLFDELGKKNQIKILTYFKGRCQFTMNNVYEFEPCDEWMVNVLDAIVKDDPDMVFTVGDFSEVSVTEMPAGFVEAWERLERAHIPMLLMRDTPRFEDSVIDCLDQNDGDIDACKEKRSEILLDVGTIDQLEELPSNIMGTLDVSDVFCDADYCYPVVGNVVAYFDRKHITATMSKSFLPVLEDDILGALEKSKKYKKK